MLRSVPASDSKANDVVVSRVKGAKGAGACVLLLAGRRVRDQIWVCAGRLNRVECSRTLQ